MDRRRQYWLRGVGQRRMRLRRGHLVQLPTVWLIMRLNNLLRRLMRSGRSRREPGILCWWARMHTGWRCAVASLLNRSRLGLCSRWGR